MKSQCTLFNKQRLNTPAFNKQEGVVLVTSLIFLLVLTIFGVVTLSTGSLQEKMAANNQVVSLSTNSAQAAIDAYTSEGMLVSNGSLSHPTNIGNQIVRRTWNATAIAVEPFVPLAVNAVTSCVNNVGANINGANCAVDFLASLSAVAPIKSRSQAYYVSCQPAFCGPGMASSLGVGSINGCMRFFVEGTGWLDLDGNGLPPVAGGEESPVYVSEWMRWQRPTLCVGS